MLPDEVALWLQPWVDRHAWVDEVVVEWVDMERMTTLSCSTWTRSSAVAALRLQREGVRRALEPLVDALASTEWTQAPQWGVWVAVRSRHVDVARLSHTYTGGWSIQLRALQTDCASDDSLFVS
jgi:hypothetical protein